MTLITLYARRASPKTHLSGEQLTLLRYLRGYARAPTKSALVATYGAVLGQQIDDYLAEGFVVADKTFGGHAEIMARIEIGKEVRLALKVLLGENRLVSAIKYLRELYGFGLLEAKLLVEDYRDNHM